MDGGGTAVYGTAWADGRDGDGIAVYGTTRAAGGDGDGTAVYGTTGETDNEVGWVGSVKEVLTVESILLGGKVLSVFLVAV